MFPGLRLSSPQAIVVVLDVKVGFHAAFGVAPQPAEERGLGELRGIFEERPEFHAAGESGEEPARFSCMKSSTQRSRSQAMTMAVTARSHLDDRAPGLAGSRSTIPPFAAGRGSVGEDPEMKSTPMKSTVVMTSGRIGAKRAATPATTPLTNLNKASIGRTAVEDVLSRDGTREFVPVVFEIGRGTRRSVRASQRRAWHRPLAGLFVGRLAPGGFQGGRSALSGADVEPRLQGESCERGPSVPRGMRRGSRHGLRRGVFRGEPDRSPERCSVVRRRRCRPRRTCREEVLAPLRKASFRT